MKQNRLGISGRTLYGHGHSLQLNTALLRQGATYCYGLFCLGCYDRTGNLFGGHIRFLHDSSHSFTSLFCTDG